MMEFFAIVVGQSIGVLLWSFLNATVLIWRARRLRSWAIRYRDAYVVSIKAGVAALLFADAAILAASVIGGSNEKLLDNVGLLFGVIAWWFMHSSALLKVAGTSNPLTVKEARAISASVFGFLLGILFALAIGVLLIFFYGESTRMTLVSL